MVTKTLIEVWVLVDEQGNHVCSPDADSLAELYEEKIGGTAELARRVLRLVVLVPLPEAVVLRGEAPVEGEAQLTVEG